MGETAGQLKSSYKYPIAEFLNLLNNSNPVLKFSSKGVAQIMIDSGLIDYEFTLPGANWFVGTPIRGSHKLIPASLKETG